MSPAKNAGTRAGQARLDAMMAEVEEFDDLDAAYAEVRRKPYGFKWAGRNWVLPHIGSLDWRLQTKIENLQGLGIEDIYALFGEMFGPEQAKAWKETVQPTDALPLLFDRWLAHSKVKPGEDEASNTSSEHTGENSRPTSVPSTDSDSLPSSSVVTVEAPVLSLPANSST